MEALLDLEPRDIIAELIEPPATFTESFAASHADRDRCFFTVHTPTTPVCTSE